MGGATFSAYFGGRPRVGVEIVLMYIIISITQIGHSILRGEAEAKPKWHHGEEVAVNFISIPCF